MPNARMVRWQWLERRSPGLFVLAGLLWAGDAAVNYYELFTDATVPGVVFGLFILSALLGTMVGVLGFHRPIADRSPRLALAGTIPVVAAGIVALPTLAWLVVAEVMNLPPPPGATGLVVIVLVTVGLLSFGVASVRTETPARTAGILVLALVGLLLVFLGGAAGLYPPFEGSSAVFTTVLAALSLAIGYVLRTAQPPHDGADGR